MRLFIATTFPAQILHSLNERVAYVRPRLPPASWVRPDAQHLTFAFLGEQPEGVVDKLTPLLCARLRQLPRFEATLKGCGFFPNARHARVGWVGALPEERFSEVAMAVRETVSEAGIELDRSEFRPHLTLMRIRDHWPPLSIETFSKGLRDFCSAPFGVDRVTLYSSKLSPHGAEHMPLKEFSLA